MQNLYMYGNSILDQKPVVNEIQAKFMHEIGFAPVKRNGIYVLWELKNWTNVSVWLKYFQVDLSVQYVMMMVFKTGMEQGKRDHTNDMRFLLGMTALEREDVERLSSFDNPWLGIHMNPGAREESSELTNSIDVLESE